MQQIEAILFDPAACLAEFPAEPFDETLAPKAYDDVLLALSELKAMGIRLFIASSFSNAGIATFLKQNALEHFFTAVWTGDSGPLQKTIAGASLNPKRTMFITDTEEGLKLAKSLGVHSILMMNDPDEARKLSALGPSGGIVSLHELPDFIRLVAANQ